MRFEITSNSLDKISADVVLVFAFSRENDKKFSWKFLEPTEVIDSLLEGQVSKAAELEKFTGKRGEMLSIVPAKKTLPSRVIVLGLGKKEEFTSDDLRRAVGRFSSRMRKVIDSVSLAIPQELQDVVDLATLTQVIGEGLLLGSYEFAKYKEKKKDEREFASVIVSVSKKSDEKIIHDAIKKAELYANATILARDLVNEQPRIATPSFLAKLAQDIARKNPKHVQCTIFDKNQAEKLGMDAFLSIASASSTPPKFIFLEYAPEKSANKKKLALVGKGITFDSGGINVKPGDHMQDMKMDMAGAAAVLGVFSVISDIRPSFPVMGLIAATPNSVSGTSILPGDVAKALNGKTIEILNTDAEGRVTLADSLSFAVQKGATEIIDLATLTGAAMVALGEDIAALFANNQDLTNRLRSAAKDAGEKVWELPLEKDYKDKNRSAVADIANIPNNRYAGTITAALFLEEFVDNKSWAHLDIAGPAFLARASDISQKGGTGFGVRMLLTLLQERS